MLFGLPVAVDAPWAQKAEFVRQIGEELERLFAPKNYGSSVRDVVALAALIDDRWQPRPKPRRRPRYIAGKRTMRVAGTSYEIDNLLEFTIRCNPDCIERATTPLELAQCLRGSFLEMLPELHKVKIPDFDVDRFAADFSAFLSGIGQKRE